MVVFDNDGTLQPEQLMPELLDCLRANGFKTCIFSGGGVEFTRTWAGYVHSIPPEQAAGSSVETKHEALDGEPVIVRLPD